MAIDPNNPKKSKKTLPEAREAPAVKAARNYQDLVRTRELLLQEIIDDLGGQITVTPLILELVERRCQNLIAAGLDWKDVSDFLEG